MATTDKKSKVNAELDGEEWIDVVGYEGVYQVSNFGRIRSMPRLVKSRWGTNKPVKGCIMSPRSSMGYLNFNARHEGSSKTLQVADVVAAAFIGPKGESMEIDHIDHDRSNNRLSNLRYVTRTQNARNRADSKLDYETASKVKKISGIPQREIGEMFGVSQSMVSKIKLSLAWKNG